jgi:hypothetical protein
MAQADPAVEAARREVVAARGELGGDIDALKASARHALDLKERAKESPAKVAAVAGGAGFVLLGGPGRILRGMKRAIGGTPAPYPSKMLPEEIDRVVSRLGDDGEKVRGVLEREFASYLAEKKRADRRFWRNAIVGSLVAPAARAALTSAVRRAVAPPATGPDAAPTSAAAAKAPSGSEKAPGKGAARR